VRRAGVRLVCPVRGGRTARAVSFEWTGRLAPFRLNGPDGSRRFAYMDRTACAVPLEWTGRLAPFRLHALSILIAGIDEVLFGFGFGERIPPFLDGTILGRF